MPGLTELCKKHFNSTCLYEVLGIEKTCDDAAVKKAYYKQSLKVHPDRVSEDEKEEATEKFQTLGKVYSVLGDKEKRKIYDETGSVDDDDFAKGDVNWEDYWRLLFKKVTKEDIVEFETKYKGSEEEAEDVRQLYEEHKGDMDKIMSSVMCATAEDEPRIREIIQRMIDEGQVKSFKAFASEPEKKKQARMRKAGKEAAEAEEMAKELGLDKNSGEDGLRALIQRRNQDRAAASDNFFSALEAKYGGGGGNNKKKGKPAKKKAKMDNSDEDDDEEEEVKPKKKTVRKKK